MSDFLSDADFARFRDLIYNESGIHFSSTNRTILESRLRERLRFTDTTSVADYYSLATSDGQELKSLLDSVTTNLTRFFRNASHWQSFEKHTLPDLVEYKRNEREKKVRVWSAGCSTGEEAYTVAILLTELLPRDFDFEILASDLSLKSLLIGQEGFYGENRVSGIPPAYLSRYFEKREGGYRCADSLKKHIQFDYHNLKHDNGKRNLDIIFCRNVLIYFDDAAQATVVDRFWDAMAPHSYLYIGHSESLLGMETKFTFVRTDWAFVYGKQV